MLFRSPLPPGGAPPTGVQTGAAIGAVAAAGVSLLVQVVIVLGLRSRDRGFQEVAAVLAGMGALGIAFVAFFMGAELLGGQAPVWLWPVFLLLVGTGALYLAAAVLGFRGKGLNPTRAVG